MRLPQEQKFVGSNPTLGNDGQMTEWLKVPDCKSGVRKPAQVQILVCPKNQHK